LNIFEDYEVKAGAYQNQIQILKQQIQDKDIRINQLMKELENTKIELQSKKTEK